MIGKPEQDGEGGRTVLHGAPTPFFSDWGCHVRIRGLVLALAGRGFRNLVCTYHHGREVEGVSTQRIPRIPGFAKQEAGPSHYRFVADVLLFLKALAVAWRKRPEVIHGHLHEGTLAGWAVRTVLFWRRTPWSSTCRGT